IARRDTLPLDNIAFGRVNEMFMEHFELPLTVQTLADRIGMDEFTFSRAFKARTGKSPYKYLLHLRVERALHMLTNTDMALVDMAYACGFSSQAHFTTVFKRIVGVSPGAYRLSR
ncbi:MAG: helix-turn-helix domain-containing protein, partial [Pseudomonadota bacterium]